jgi:GR25 family glycosyltransferase involved in LPS biosynthesis
MTLPDHSPWSFFDRLYCISLETRPDRRESARREFSRIGILDRVAFILVQKDPEDPCRGIFESHRLCMERALADGARNLVIFEDDVIFRRYDPETLSACLRHLSGGEGWDMLFFGCLTRGIARTGCPGLKQVRYHALTHAYALTRERARTVVGLAWTGVPYDLVLRGMEGRYFGVSPFFAFQSNAATDNDACRRLDRFRRLLGGLAVIQAVSEFHQGHRVAVIVLHLALLALAGVWLC